MHQFQDISTDHTEPDSTPVLNGASSTSAAGKPEQERPLTPTPPQPQTQPVKTSCQSQETPKRTSLGIPQALSTSGVQILKGLTLHTAAGLPRSPQPMRPKAHTIGEAEKIGTLGSLSQ